jgi:hypothetical protein
MGDRDTFDEADYPGQMLDAMDAVNGSAGDPGVAAAARQARRLEAAAADYPHLQTVTAAEVRAGITPSPAAVVLAESLAELAGDYLGAEWYPVDGVPTAFRVLDSGGTGGPTLLVHVMEVGK